MIFARRRGMHLASRRSISRDTQSRFIAYIFPGYVYAKEYMYRRESGQSVISLSLLIFTSTFALPLSSSSHSFPQHCFIHETGCGHVGPLRAQNRNRTHAYQNCGILRSTVIGTKSLNYRRVYLPIIYRAAFSPARDGYTRRIS